MEVVKLLRYHPNLFCVLFFGFDMPSCYFVFENFFITLYYLLFKTLKELSWLLELILPYRMA